MYNRGIKKLVTTPSWIWVFIRLISRKLEPETAWNSVFINIKPSNFILKQFLCFKLQFYGYGLCQGYLKITFLVQSHCIVNAWPLNINQLSGNLFSLICALNRLKIAEIDERKFEWKFRKLSSWFVFTSPTSKINKTDV